MAWFLAMTWCLASISYVLIAAVCHLRLLLVNQPLSVKISYHLHRQLRQHLSQHLSQLKGRNTALEPETRIVYTLVAHRPLPLAKCTVIWDA
jgi:hypothetical protein